MFHVKHFGANFVRFGMKTAERELNLVPKPFHGGQRALLLSVFSVSRETFIILLKKSAYSSFILDGIVL